MDNGIPSTESDEDLLAAAAEEYFAAAARGEKPSITEVAGRYPQIAANIREVFPALALVGDSISGKRGNDHIARFEAPKQLGDYRLVREIGCGGMGVVYEAEQQSIERRVALKILPFASLATETALKRFKNEIRTAASLEHPHIISVFASGEERGVHYFAMQLIRGCSLADAISGLLTGNTRKLSNADSIRTPATQADVEMSPVAQLSTVRTGNKSAFFQQAAKIAIQACDALQYAHQMGVVHRDVKPSNLMLDANGRIWLTDFGLALVQAEAGLTMTGDVVGTLRYMSPEQALGKGILDHRSDVYSLGATLYELITLQPPIVGADRHNILRLIADQQPTSPRSLDASIPADLETIILKAMEKDPSDRYSSAQEMAEDLARYGDGKSIKARRPSAVQVVQRWARRRVGVIIFALAASLLGLGLLGATTGIVAKSRQELALQQRVALGEKNKAVAQRNIALTERDKAQLNRYYAEIVAGQIDVENKNYGGLRDILARHLPLVGKPDHRCWEWYYLMSLCHPEQQTFRSGGRHSFAAWSPDDQLIGSPGVIRRSVSGERIRTLNPSTVLQYRVAWRPDGQQFAWGMASDENAFYVWDRKTDHLHRVTGHKDSVWCLVWSPDGAQIATGSLDNTVKIWDATDLTMTRDIGMPKSISGVAWSPDGEWLATSLQLTKMGVQLIRPATGEIAAKLLPNANEKVSATWQPGGGLAIARQRGWYLVDPADWSETFQHALSRGGEAIACSPNGRLMAVADGETVKVWTVNGQQTPLELNGHLSKVISVDWRQDSRQLVTSSDDSEIKIWDVTSLARPANFTLNAAVDVVEWSSDSQTVIGLDASSKSYIILNANSGATSKHQLDNAERSEFLSQDRRLGGSYDQDRHAIEVVDLASGDSRSVLPLQKGHRVGMCSLAGNTTKLAVATAMDSRQFLSIWDLEHEKLLSVWERDTHDEDTEPFRFLTWNREDTLVAAVGFGDYGDNGGTYWNDFVHVIDAATGKRIFKRSPAGGNKTPISSLAWAPSADRLAVATADGRIELLDVRARTVAVTEKVLHNTITSVSWHPSGRRLACASVDGDVKIIASDRGTSLLTFEASHSGKSILDWSADGQKLVAASATGQLRIWDASGGYKFADNGARRGELAWRYYERRALRSVVETAPDVPDYWHLRGSAFAELGDYGRAIEEYSKAISKPTHSMTASLARAYALLANGDVGRYQDACATLWAEFRESPVRSNRLAVAELCAASGESEVDFSQIVADFKPFLEPLEREKDESLSRRLMGAILVRNQDYEEAAATLSEEERSFDSGGDPVNSYELAYTQYFLAIARAGMGHSFQARRMVSLANDNAKAAGQGVWNLQRAVTLKVLREETERVVQ